MNNSGLSITEEKEDLLPIYRKREGELVKIIEAINLVKESEPWSTLKSSVFDGALESLEKRLVSEAKKGDVDLPEIYRLQGQITWAKKYSHLDTVAESFKLELISVRKKLNS